MRRLRRFLPWPALAVTIVFVMAAVVMAATRTTEVDNQAPATTVVTLRQPTSSTTPAPPAAASAVLERFTAPNGAGCLTVRRSDVVIFESNPTTALAPASVIKVLTAAAALEGIGTGARLRTVVSSSAIPREGVVLGDVSIVGGGDPVLGTAGWAARSRRKPPVYTSLDVLADRVVAAGVRRIEGAIIGDGTRYDSQRYVATWPRRLVTDGESGPLSALIVNDGLRVWGHPGVPFDDVPRGTAELLRGLLIERGVEVAGSASSGTAAGAVELAAIESPPVGDLVGAMLQDSDNETAELLVKELGWRRFRDGSTAAGTRAVTDILASKGLPTEGNVVADGSGLSSVDRVTCRLVAAVLTTYESELASQVAIAGQTGTLAARYRGTDIAGRLRGKTGSITGISALAGFVTNADGGPIAFAHIVNDVSSAAAVRSVQDALVRALVSVPM